MYNFLSDVFKSLINKHLVGKIQNSNLYIGLYNLSIEADSYYLIKASNNHQRVKSITLSFSDFTNNKLKQIEVYDHVIVIFENGEIRFYENEDAGTYISISDKEDLFNISIKYDVYYTFEDLLFIKRRFKKLVKIRNITDVTLDYSKGEEKIYGY